VCESLGASGRGQFDHGLRILPAFREQTQGS